MAEKDVDIEGHMPYKLGSSHSDESPSELVDRRRAEIREIVTRTGSVLFRGFDVKDVDGFGDVVRALSENPLPYTERSSPHSTIKGHIYTSTDYPSTRKRCRRTPTTVTAHGFPMMSWSTCGNAIASR